MTWKLPPLTPAMHTVVTTLQSRAARRAWWRTLLGLEARGYVVQLRDASGYMVDAYQLVDDVVADPTQPGDGPHARVRGTS